MKTGRFYRKMMFFYEQDKADFVFEYLNKKFGHKECGYNVIVKDEKMRSCELNIRKNKVKEVKYLCENMGIETREIFKVNDLK